ncbi:hypothetical protein EAH77_15710 [Ewingella americana]|uniref:Uncharacterized protein n=2 Tax=Ewingella americana TaxID=41202 RepID=A0A502GEG3_9GAMM|nr:hypothetical protein EAH77_15710 [Ewingella americana]
MLLVLVFGLSSSFVSATTEAVIDDNLGEIIEAQELFDVGMCTFSQLYHYDMHLEGTDIRTIMERYRDIIKKSQW